MALVLRQIELADVPAATADRQVRAAPAVKEFVAAYQKQYPGVAIRVPGNVYHNG